jgi:hypothetical protein
MYVKFLPCAVEPSAVHDKKPTNSLKKANSSDRNMSQHQFASETRFLQNTIVTFCICGTVALKMYNVSICRVQEE